MKHIADRNYKDLTLNKHIEKNAVLEEEYEKAGVELTEERKRYLVEERKLYNEVVEETEEVEEGISKDKIEVNNNIEQGTQEEIEVTEEVSEDIIEADNNIEQDTVEETEVDKEKACPGKGIKESKSKGNTIGGTKNKK